MLGLVAAGCSIPIGSAGDLRLVPSVRADQLGNGVSVGGSIMGLNLGFAAGGRCFGIVSSIQNNGRCVGVGVGKRGEGRSIAPTNVTTAEAADPPSTKAITGPREQITAAPTIHEGQPERGVSGGANLFGLGLGVSMSGRCLGVTAAKDGTGRCLGIGLRPSGEPDAPRAPGAGGDPSTVADRPDRPPAEKP